MIVGNLLYQDENLEKRSATLEKSVNRDIGSWSNPDWVVTGRPQNDWITYKGADGGIWQTKVHCDIGFLGFGGFPHVYFENKHPDQNSANTEFIEIMNHENKAMVVKLIAERHPNDNDTIYYTFDLTPKG